MADAQRLSCKTKAGELVTPWDTRRCDVIEAARIELAIKGTDLYSALEELWDEDEIRQLILASGARSSY
jgi:hypothetical protein